MWLRRKRSPSESVFINDTQLLSSFVDQFAQFFWTKHYALFLMNVFSLDNFSDLGILPRCIQVKLTSSLEFLLGFNVRIENPFSLLERNI